MGLGAHICRPTSATQGLWGHRPLALELGAGEALGEEGAEDRSAPEWGSKSSPRPGSPALTPPPTPSSPPVQALRLSTNSTPSRHLGLPLTHPPRLRSQGARVLRTNSPRQSTRAWTMAGWACRTQSTASPAATEYRDTTLPHVMPAGRETDAGQQKESHHSPGSSPALRSHEA